MARGFHVECDEDGIKHVELDAFGKWVLGIFSGLVLFGIPASIGFAVSSSVQAATTAAHVEGNSRRLDVLESSIAGISVNTARTAQDVEWIKGQWTWLRREAEAGR